MRNRFSGKPHCTSAPTCVLTHLQRVRRDLDPRTEASDSELRRAFVTTVWLASTPKRNQFVFVQ